MSIEGTELMMNLNDPVAPEPDAAVLRVMVIVPGLVEMIWGSSGRTGIPVRLREMLCVLVSGNLHKPSLIRTGPHVTMLLMPTELLTDMWNE